MEAPQIAHGSGANVANLRRKCGHLRRKCVGFAAQMCGICGANVGICGAHSTSFAAKSSLNPKTSQTHPSYSLYKKALMGFRDSARPNNNKYVYSLPSTAPSTGSGVRAVAKHAF